MKAIIGYILNMLPYIAVCIPVYALTRFLLYRKTKTPNILRETAMLIFFAFCVGLASQTVIPKLEFGDGIGIVSSGISEINLIPFKSIAITYTETFVYGHTRYFVINFLGNLAVFAPFGFFIPLLFKIKGRYAVVIGCLISVFIETAQYFIGRNTDIDDVILNTLGAAIGLMIYKLLSKRFAAFFEKFKKS